jgi:hypothetical protein
VTGSFLPALAAVLPAVLSRASSALAAAAVCPMNLSGQDAREKEQVFLSHLSNLLDASPLEPPTKKRRSMNEVITRICDDNQGDRWFEACKIHINDPL